jgi:hypothetical protein
MREKFYEGSRGCWLLVIAVFILLLGGVGIGFFVLRPPLNGNPESSIASGDSQIEPTEPLSPVATSPVSAACRVPELVGLDQTVAERTLTGLGLQPIRNTQVDADTPTGQVIAQEPAPNTLLDPCKGGVDIVVSIGPVSTSTPPSTPTREESSPTIPATSAPLPPTSTPLLPTDTPEPTPTPAPSPFVDNFDSVLRPEWVILRPGLALNQGLLSASGIDGILLYDSPGANYRVRTSVKGGGIKIFFRAL